MAVRLPAGMWMLTPSNTVGAGAGASSFVGELDGAGGQRLGGGRVGNDGRAVGDRKDAGCRREGLIQVRGELLDREDRAERAHGDAEGEARLGQRQCLCEHVRARDHGDRDDAEGDGGLVEPASQRDPATLGAKT